MIVKLLFISFSGAFFCFLVQSWPRFISRYFGVDVWRHLLAAEFIRKNKKLPVESLEAYLFKGKFDYPPLFLIFISLLPKETAEKFQGFISPFIEFLHSLLIFWTCFILTKNPAIAFGAQIIYALIPVVVMENSQLSARGFGSFVFSLSFVPMIFYSVYGADIFLWLAVFFTAALFMSHKMAAQAMCFTTALFSILDRNIAYLLIYLAAFALVWLMFPKLYKRIFMGQIAVLKFFQKNIRVRYAHQIKGSTKKPQLNADFVNRIKGLIGRFPVAAVITSNPFIVMFVVMYITFVFNPNVSYLLPITYQVFGKFLLWLVIMYIMGVLTAQVRLFQFLGEGTKYTLYAAFPLSIILAAFSSYCLDVLRDNRFFLSLIIFGLVSWALILFLQKKIILKDKVRSFTPGLVKMVNFLRSVKEDVRLAVFPLSTAEIISYFAGCKVLSTDSAYAHGYNEDYLNFNPVLRKPLKYFFDKYRINYVLINKNYVILNEMCLEDVELTREEEDFILLKYRAV